ncbi:MAG: glycosyltransferase family 4 protein [Myxococcales bacterium]|nr:MAG: glycosyltransferase family 4 protein [Myxococcales bacterium]
MTDDFTCNTTERPWNEIAGSQSSVTLRPRELELSSNPERTQFHLLSFEAHDSYSRAGGLGTRVIGLSEALARAGYPTHVWFVGDPALPGYEADGALHLHRWCQWISAYHPKGVYDGDAGKENDYASSLPPHLVQAQLLPHIQKGGKAVVIAEEWQTVNAVLHLDWLLRKAGIRQHVRIFWNANNVFGFEHIDWKRLERAAIITTVSRYMKQLMAAQGIESVSIPNGLAPDAYQPADSAAVRTLRQRFSNRLLLTKMARWDPDKRWLGSVELVRELKSQGYRPLLIARGGSEAHGDEVLRAMADSGLHVLDRKAAAAGGLSGFIEALDQNNGYDVINYQSFIDSSSRRVLFQASDAVLANSRHEPFGLVGLEAMAVGGIACTGCTGEEYAIGGHNALVLQTGQPSEFMGLYSQLRHSFEQMTSMRMAGRQTAQQYAWSEIIQSSIIPRVLCAGPEF